MDKLSLKVLLGAAAGMALSLAMISAAQANCIAHQPADMHFTAPQGVQLAWECTTAGPWVYDHQDTETWYFITFKATNNDARTVRALKVQANLVDAFGDVSLTVPISETAQITQGQSDGAIYAFRNPIPANNIDHVDFYLMGVSYVDGSVWMNSDAPKGGPLTQVAISRFPMTYSLLDFWPPAALSHSKT